MPDYQHFDDELTPSRLLYWSREFRRLRLEEMLGFSLQYFFEEFDEQGRNRLRRWVHRRLQEWRDNPRYQQLAGCTWVLDWSTDNPRDAEAGIDPDILEKAGYDRVRAN
jgi:hypothetical protein